MDIVQVQSLDEVFLTAKTVGEDECPGSVMNVSLTLSWNSNGMNAYGTGLLYFGSSWLGRL